MKPHLVVIAGPTASGKTRIAVELAVKFGLEIISADSRQVYKGLDIGTGKDALLARLDDGHLAGAALDVLPDEPPAADAPVLRHRKIQLSPHAALTLHNLR